MRIAILALGSRGDVQPFIALALALRRAGHRVQMIGLADYAALVADYGLPYTVVVGAARDLMDRELVYDALDAAGALPLGFARRFIVQVAPLVSRLCAECLRACADADLLIASTLGLYPGLFIAEKLGLPLVPAHFHPQGTTAMLPDLAFAPLPRWLPLHRLYNRATHHLAAHGLWQLLRGPLNQARRDVFDLAPLSAPALWQRVQRCAPLALYAYSARIAPPPPDWPSSRRVTGYWRLERPPSWEPPVALSRFLAAGPPPVYLGFGSVLAGRDPAAVTALLVEALDRAGVRGLIYRGAWDDLAHTSLPAHIMAIEATPHGWLFRRVAAVVSHGGAGTIAAALHAGAPIVTIPFYSDQHFWGQRVAALGAGPAPIARRQLEAQRLAAAIQHATNDPAMRIRATALGNALTGEDGAARAVELLGMG